MSHSTPSGRSAGGAPFWEPPSPEELSQAIPAYDVQVMLGRGGMGAVYRAVQRSLKRTVAIKVLPPTADDELKFAERFRHEAETLARLNHPGIVHIHDFGETVDGLLYLVMEFVDGTDVHQLIQANGRLSEDYALAVTAHVCDALAYAHSRGIVHRDIKPANVLIDQEGNVKVADFGLAKMVDPTFDSGLTMSNVALGTPDFVAPEVLSMGMTVDHRADLYAVGVMLYQMLTGELPRGLFKLPSQKYQEIDPRLDGVICRALEPDREERYQSAVEVRAELIDINTSRLARMEEARLVIPTPMPRRRKGGKTAAMIAVLAILGAAGAWGWKTLSVGGSASTTAPPIEINLLETVDLKRDVIAGDWYWDPAGLRSRGSGMVPGERGGYPRVEFAHVPPAEYDLEVEFTSDSNEYEAGLIFPVGGKQTGLIANIHGGVGYVAGLEGVGGAPMHTRQSHDVRPTPYFRKGQRQVALVQVRKDRVTTLLDGEVIEDWPLTQGFINALDLGSDYALGDPAKPGIMAGPSTPIAFHRVVVREKAEIPSPGSAMVQNSDSPHPKLDKSFWGQVSGVSAERKVEIVEATLELINGNDLSLKPTIEGGKVTALTITQKSGEPLHDLSPVAALTDLKIFFCYVPGVRDLEWLRGMPIEHLQLENAWVEDLRTLREAKISHLDLDFPVKAPADYSLLAGLPLRSLSLQKCPLKDLTFLSGMALNRLVLTGTGITDYSPLKALPLAEVELDLVPERDLPILLSIPTLKKINGKPVEEYRGDLTVAAEREVWTDWLGPRLADPYMFHSKEWQRRDGGISTDQVLRGTEIFPEGTRDGAVRVTFSLQDSEGVQVSIRDTKDRGGRHTYVAQYTGTNLFIAHYPPAPGSMTRLVNEPIPESVKSRPEHTLEVRFAGDRLEATLDGEFHANTRHSLLREGPCAVVLTKGVLVKSIETMKLDQGAGPPPVLSSPNRGGGAPAP